jgi:hypothetical protein
VASGAPAQNLFVADYAAGNIYAFTTDGAQSTFASGVNGPRGLAFNSAGDLFEADLASDEIHEFTPGGVEGTFASGLNAPYGLAFNTAGDLFVSDDDSGNIYEFTTKGVQSTFASGLARPTGLAFDGAGNLFVGDQFTGCIYEFTTNGMKSTFASGLDTPLGLAFNSAGDLFEADYHSGNIYEFTTNGVRSTFVSGLDNPEGLAFNSAGVLFEADEGSGNIYEFTTNGVQSTFASGLAHPTGLAFQPIEIVSDLANTSVILGSNSFFTVSATSSAPLTYQWYFVPANNDGQAEAYAETISEFVYGAVVTNGGFGYGNIPSVSFTDGGGSGAAGYATVSNGVVVGITVTNAGFGYSATPNVLIEPPNGLFYGQTNSTLNITNANTNNLGSYFVVVSGGGYSVTSSVVSLILAYPPSIVDQPQDFIANGFGTASFNVTEAGTPPLSYQWSFDDTNIPNATNSIFTISSVRQSDLGQYDVSITSPYGAVTSSVANLYMYPYINSPFTGLDTYWGQTNTLSVNAWGSGDLTYQWYQNGVALAGATNAALTIPDIQFTNAGSYYVVVSSGTLGSATNATYQVIVNPANVSIMLTPDVVIQGTVGFNYIIESSTNLGNPNSWIIETNLTLTQPIESWNDNSEDVRSRPQKFYQVLSGQ